VLDDHLAVKDLLRAEKVGAHGPVIVFVVLLGGSCAFIEPLAIELGRTGVHHTLAYTDIRPGEAIKTPHIQEEGALHLHRLHEGTPGRDHRCG